MFSELAFRFLDCFSYSLLQFYEMTSNQYSSNVTKSDENTDPFKF